MNVQEDTLCTGHCSIEHDRKSEEIEIKCNAEHNVGLYKTHIKKSLSLGSGLDRRGRVCNGNDLDSETDLGFSDNGTHDQSGSVISTSEKDPEFSPSNRCLEAPNSVSLQVNSDMVNNESVFAIGDPQQSEKGDYYENFDIRFPGECSNTPRIPHYIVMSRSLPNMVSYGGHSTMVNIVPRVRSCEDLSVFGLKQNKMLVHKVGTQVSEDDEKDDAEKKHEKTYIKNPADDVYDGYNYAGSVKDWIIPVNVMDGVNTLEISEAESAIHRWEKLPSKDFKVKRIQEWVMDLQHSAPLEEKYELSTSFDHLEDHGATVLDGLTSARQDSKITPGMEAAKRYISSLSATATSAQLANHGLVVIPFLSVFVSLKALNLSGNAIVRITAGVLPRGLHNLNLSKNNISTIEGLRELTRLRVLDLSYNRILRIGHGLASCSSVKELYLAGNKISEVEGLHRLLKLNILDLRFNKLSTTKCLGQLAANYNSLQAVSLEGNPAQKNVGDEQLKKYLQGLLPRIAYFNRQSIKAGTLKDSADRSTRLGISAHQSDRGLRSDLKAMRKGNHGVAAAQKRSYSSIHGRKSQQGVALAKPSRERQGRLTPSGIKTFVKPSFYDFGSKLLSFRPDLTMHKSRSQGNLGGI